MLLAFRADYHNTSDLILVTINVTNIKARVTRSIIALP
jgi:hypothetical protein